MSRFRTHLWVLLVSTTLGFSTRALVWTEERPAILVYSWNLAKVPPDVLRDVKAIVNDVMDAAGIRVEWRDVRYPLPVRESPPLARVFAVDLVNAPTPEDGSEHVRLDVLGSAAREVNRAFVFVNRVQLAASTLPVDVPTVLAHVISHELGHLLLPPGSHSPDGVMRASLDFARPQSNRFTRQQAETMRSAVASRAAAR